MNKVNFNVEKIDGGFIVCVNTPDNNTRKIVRKLSEVIALLKTTLADKVEE